MSNTALDILYLNEEDMIKAGVLDAGACIETMRDTLSLFGKKDFLLGGPKADEHGLQMNFPQTSDIEGFPLDDGPDRRFMAMPDYLGGRFHIAGYRCSKGYYVSKSSQCHANRGDAGHGSNLSGKQGLESAFTDWSGSY